MMKWRIYVRVLCIFVFCNLLIVDLASGADPVLTVKSANKAYLSIDPKRTIRAKIPTNIYSINMQYNLFEVAHWDRKKRKVKSQVLDNLKTLPGGMYRYPGGLVSNQFDWEASIIDYDRRVEKRLAYGNMSRNTYFGVGEYLDFMKEVGTRTPWYTLNLQGRGTGDNPVELPSRQLAESNERLAKYIKKRTPNLDRRFYQLGNELDINQFQWSYNKYIKRALETIEKISAVDPKARFVPFMREFWWNYRPPKSGVSKPEDYFNAVMKALPMVRDFSLQIYFDGKLYPEDDYVDVPEVIERIEKSVAMAKAARSGHYNVWITEYGKRFFLKGDKEPESGTSLDAALAAGDLLVALAQLPVVRGAMMQCLDGGGRKLYFDSDTPTSSFWALQILSNQPYKRVLASTTSSPNSSGYHGGYDVRAVATTNDGGNVLGVNAVNRSRQGQTLRIKYPPLAGKTRTEKRRYVRGPEGKNPKFVEKGFTVQSKPLSKAKTFNADGEVVVWLPPLSVSSFTFN